MTKEQRRQAAAQRCADLANALAIKPDTWTPNEFLHGGSKDAALLNAILQLDELARNVIAAGTSVEVYNAARQHILPEPKPSPVERVAEAIGLTVEQTSNMLATAEVKLVEVDPSDDQ